MVPTHALLLRLLLTVGGLALCQVARSTQDEYHTSGGHSVQDSSVLHSMSRTSRQTTNMEPTNSSTSSAFEALSNSIPESSATSAAPLVSSTSSSLHLTMGLGNSATLPATVDPFNVVTRVLPNTSDDQPPTLNRGDLPPNLDSVETLEDVSGLLFSPLDMLFTPSEELPGNEPTTSENSFIDHSPTGYREIDFHSPTSSVSVNDNSSELASVNELRNITVEFSQTTVSSFDLLRETPQNKPTNIEDIYIDQRTSEDLEVVPHSLISPASVSDNPSGSVTLKEFSAVTVEFYQTTVPNFYLHEAPKDETTAIESSLIGQSPTGSLEVDLHAQASPETVSDNPSELVSVKEFSNVTDEFNQTKVSSFNLLHETSENERNAIENSLIDQSPEGNHEVDLHSQLIPASVRDNSSGLSTLEELSGFTGVFNNTTDSSFNSLPKTPGNEPISTENRFISQSPVGGLELEFDTLARTVSVSENPNVVVSVNEFNDVTSASKIAVEFKETTISSFYLLHEENPTENVADTSNFLATDLYTDGFTSHTSSFQELYDNRIWFFVVLRGNCHLVNLDNTNVLASDFITSFLLLLLYNKDKIVVHSIECSGHEMKVNMTIDSASYPNCEEDLKTLLSHKNLRIHLHNTSFYIESYETKRTLIFETKSDIEKDSFNILYVILGCVGVSLMFIIIAAIIFVVYRHFVLKKTKFNLGTLDTILSESPRSLHYKTEMAHTVRFSDTNTYCVKMYKSCSDLSSPDPYDQYGSINHSRPTKDSSPKASTNTSKPKRNINQSHGGSYNLENRQRDLWLGRTTHTGEEYMTIRNVNIMNSSYGCDTGDQEESLNPLLRNGRPNSRLETTSAHTEDTIDTTACPSSMATENDVMKRMDDLISTTFSNNIPNITADPVEDSTYRTAYTNVIASLPSGNLTTTITTTGNSDFSPASCSTNTNTPSYNTADCDVIPITKTSAENLCLTRITFMEMRVWPRRTAAQRNIPLLKISGKPKPP